VPDSLRWLLRGAPLAIALLGPWNTADELLRGKWVRFWDTQIAEHTATLCLSAQTEAELPAQLEALPGKLELLEQAGASVIGVDLERFGGPSEVRVSGGAFPAHAEMVHSRLPAAVLGSRGPIDGVWPMSLHALALLEESPAPEALGEGWVMGPHRLEPAGEPVLFMPVLIPFVHWDRPEEWAEVVEGKVVFVGACKLDRELTHYGRQPGPVAHGEILETLHSGFWLFRVPRAVDVLVALAFGALALVLGRRFPARAPLVGLGVAVVAVFAVLGVALSGLWMGLSGAALAALGWGLAERR
jgi:hypothetical protein